MVGPPFNFGVEWRLLFEPPEEGSLDVKMIIICVILAIFVGCAIAYGVWLKKGDKENAERPTKAK
jgi:hypothetical protein